MDITDKYIIMCKAAKEIQARESDGGDWYADDCHGIHNLGLVDFLPCNELNHSEICEKSYTWLPRQDQLQELDDYDNGVVNWDFCHWCNSWKVEYIIQFETMEQLWLAYVMGNKYQKKWNGTEWI